MRVKPREEDRVLTNGDRSFNKTVYIDEIPSCPGSSLYKQLYDLMYSRSIHFIKWQHARMSPLTYTIPNEVTDL